MTMATAAQQLQKLTECCICLKVFNDPRMLPCIHTFCFDCLKQTADAAEKKPGEDVPCPLCRKMFAIPVEGLDKLQKNFFVEHLVEVTTSLQQSNTSVIVCDICKDLYEGDERTKPATMRCLECRDNFCDVCAKAHKLQKLSKSHQVTSIGSETKEDMRNVSPKRNCAHHNGKPLDYYCPKCKKIVCVSCVVEEHPSHECKDVSTVEKEFRKGIERNALKISICADEMLSTERNVEQRQQNVLIKLTQTENKIQQRNLELKRLIDDQTKSLMDELSLIEQKQIKDFENEKEETECNHMILKSFETYLIEIKSKGSASDICSCVDELDKRANELEKDHEAFISRPHQTVEISFMATDLQEPFYLSNNNIVGRIQEDSSLFKNCVVIAGLYDGQKVMQDVFTINLHRPNDISIEQQIPTEMQNGAAAAVYRNTLYVTGIGANYNEIWKYNFFGGWMKCASMVQSRNSHCSEFVEDVLYICGGFVVADKKVLDSVEGYDATNKKCTTVGKLIHSVQDSGNCVPYKSFLYIFGGIDRDNKALNDVQVYDTKLNICTLLSKSMPLCCSSMLAALWDTSVILIGCYTCFIYNFETETWQERKQFKTDAHHFGLALENDRIFVIGGGISITDEAGQVAWTCRDDIRYVPLKSLIYDKPFEWKCYTKLSKPVLVQTYEKMTISCQSQDEQVSIHSSLGL